MKSSDSKEPVINGKTYPLWSQFVAQKAKWIGGTLEDFPDGIDRALGATNSTTEIVDIELRPNGTDSAFFEVKGKDFGCGFDVSVGGIGAGEKGWLTFHGYGGHSWRIKEPAKETPKLGCDFHEPYFGASYPDACCIDGLLWDLDSCDVPGGGLTSGGDVPCPQCNHQSWLDSFKDDFEEQGWSAFEDGKPPVYQHKKLRHEQPGDEAVVKAWWEEGYRLGKADKEKAST